jgi:prepilin-type N-terminal cleavage/methylation domain-containing protein
MTPRRRARQRGLTLVELLVTVLVGGVLAAMSLSAFMSGLNTLARADDQARGQAEATVAAQRMARDLRQARAVRTGSGASVLHLWVDLDGDAVMGPAESVTWRAVAVGDGTGHLTLERADGTGERSDVSASLVSGALFTYDTTVPATARVVTVRLEYDAVAGAYAPPKLVVFDARLRNAR